MTKPEIVWAWMDNPEFWTQRVPLAYRRYWKLWLVDPDCQTYRTFVRNAGEHIAHELTVSDQWDSYVKMFGMPERPGRFRPFVRRIQDASQSA